ncbi:hypothetical protein GW7_10971 [Heterocephalus glaber]|uniref:Uncharacterized protein n=1 Tax=Heterocephalus glaber TaxID=10181 RepID=G5AVW9_HETGA|nr:hypothetical protein GW7_10971 [Heterocephalus glaber]
MVDGFLSGALPPCLLRTLSSGSGCFGGTLTRGSGKGRVLPLRVRTSSFPLYLGDGRSGSEDWTGRLVPRVLDPRRALQREELVTEVRDGYAVTDFKYK